MQRLHHPLRAFPLRSFPIRAALAVLALPLLATLSVATPAAAHSPEDATSARADLRVDDDRGLRVRVWFEVPESNKLTRGDAADAVTHLGACLHLERGDKPVAGTWRAGDDPKHGLSNGSHRLYALEFEAKELEAGELAGGEALDIRLNVQCFPQADLGLTANVRAKPPWRIETEELPAAAMHRHGHGHGHGHEKADDVENAEGQREARVVFRRGSNQAG